MKALLKWVLIIIGALIVISMIGNALKTPEQKAADQAASQQRQLQQQRDQAEQQRAKVAAEQQALADLPTITAQTLASAYEANTVAADARFKNQRFKVSGTVVDINTDFAGNPYLTLRGAANQFLEPQFSFDKSALEQLATLKQGSKVTLLCTGNGDIAKVPMSGDCNLL